MTTPHPTPEEWEYFCDESYFDLWCVRKVGDRTFGHGYHMQNGNEAKHLCETLNAQAAALSASGTKSDVMSVRVRPLQWIRSEIFGRIKWRAWGAFGEAGSYMEDAFTPEQITEKRDAIQESYGLQILSAIEAPSPSDPIPSQPDELDEIMSMSDAEILEWAKSKGIDPLQAAIDGRDMLSRAISIVDAQPDKPAPIAGLEPVAWRWRHGAGPWQLAEGEPIGPSTHLFDVQRLYTRSQLEAHAAERVRPLVEALEGLIEAVKRDADEGGKGISGYTSARLTDAKNAIRARGQV